MSEIDRIRRFLGAMRRRLLLRAAIQAAGFGVGAMLLALLLLAATASAVGPAAFWPVLTLTVLAALALTAAAIGLWRPARGLRDDQAAARLVARLYPPVSSDLVSAVELHRHLDANTPRDAGTGSNVSASLVRAFQGDVARAVDPLDPKALVTMRPAMLAVASLVGVALVATVATRRWPSLSEGARTLLRRPTLFEGAAISEAPLVGDVRIVYRYPAYTGLPARTVEGSTGDIVAIKGTRVKLETRPLRSTRKALLLLGEDGQRGQIDAPLVGGVLTAELTVTDSGSYRFWLSPLLGRPVRELRGHRIQADADAAPRVEIFGPADRLELPGPRPIEVGFSADDDFGLARVELVYRIGNQPEQRQLLRDAGGARRAQGRTIWDPAQAGLGRADGERIAYRIEARDRDEVSGAKVGSSRTLYLVIQNPRASMEERLDRQREVLDKLSDALAERLERSPAARQLVSTAASEPAATRLTALQAMLDTEASHLALLGRLLDDDRREGELSKSLRTALAGIADRLGRLLREQGATLTALRGKPVTGGALARLERASEKQVAELEKDVLLLDDLIGRQRLEDLANMGRELTDAHQRLQDLLNRYKATKDEALRRQLEREARELQARIADLAQKIAALKARNDVPEEWRNMPDMKELAEKAKQFDDLLEKGSDDALAKALGELGENLQSLRQMLDQNAEGFGSERFPQENRVVAELMKKIGDLEGDERTLQKETQQLSEKQEAEVDRRLKGQLEEFLKAQNEKVERLTQRLSGIPTGGPETALGEEIDRARDSAKQLKRLLSERDLAEALGEAERAESSLERAADQLEEEAEGRGPDEAGKRTDKKSRGARAAEAQRATEAVSESRGLAREIADELEKVLPRPSESLSAEEREQARAQAERQGAIGNRTDETAGEAARRLGKLPGLEKAEAELKSAAARMRQAAEHLKKSEAKQAAGAQRDAADRLAKLRDSMQQRSMGTGKQQRDPVRIPGADESNAPRAWRQELLDAMKEKAPERYRDDVRRYYEELVR